MNLPNILGDYLAGDAPSGAEGVYERALRSRRWLVTSSLIAGAHAHYVVNYYSIEKITHELFRIDRQIVSIFVVSFLTFTTIQYALLMIQTIYSYPGIFYDRVERAISEEISEVEGQIRAGESDLENIRREHSERLDSIRQLQTQIVVLESEIGRYRNQGLDSDGLRDAENRLSSLSVNRDGLIAQNTNSQRIIDARQASLGAQTEKLRRRRNEAPEMRLLFRVAEVAMDLIRFGFPLALLSFAVWSLWHS